jgi:hypothetical protein
LLERGIVLGHGQLELGLGKADIGAGEFACLATGLDLIECALKLAEIGGAQAQRLGIAADVGIGGDDLQQEIAFGAAQLLPTGADLCQCGFAVSSCPAAGIEGWFAVAVTVSTLLTTSGSFEKRWARVVRPSMVRV